MGRVAAPYGVKGWLKVLPMTSALDTLLEHREVWLRRRDGQGGWTARELHEGRTHGNTLVLRLAGLADREAAAAFAGGDVGVERDALPAPDEGEIYQADLVGLAVWNRQGENLGTVSAVLEFGAHPVLRVEAGAATAEGGKSPQRLIPFVPAYVDAVDVPARRITVDWPSDY